VATQKADPKSTAGVHLVAMVNVSSHDVESSMQFVKADSKVNRRYITPGLEINTGQYETHKVHIRDIRARRQEYTLDGNGFQLFDFKTAVTPYEETESSSLTFMMQPRLTKFTPLRSKNSSKS
jgi:hypothetical protein